MCVFSPLTVPSVSHKLTVGVLPLGLQALASVEAATNKWNQLLKDADTEMNRKAGVQGRLSAGDKAPLDLPLGCRNGSKKTFGQLLAEPRHAAGLLLVVLRHFG